MIKGVLFVESVTVIQGVLPSLSSFHSGKEFLNFLTPFLLLYHCPLISMHPQ